MTRAFLMILFLVGLFSCKKYLRWDLPEKPELSIIVLSNSTEAIEFKGEILNKDHSEILRLGFTVTKFTETKEKFDLPATENNDSFALLVWTDFDFSTYYEMQFFVETDLGRVYSEPIGINTKNPLGTPDVQTISVDQIELNAALFNGKLLSSGSQPVIQRGFCWSSAPNPVLGSNSVALGNNLGDFLFKKYGLTENTKYYVRAFATNGVGTSYGETISFTTRSLSQLSYGDSVFGGLFFCYLTAGDVGYVSGEVHGLVAATSDVSSGAKWGCTGVLSSSNDPYTVQVLGQGQVFTNEIVSSCNEPGIAARLCADLSLNGYTDWYLPNNLELKKLYFNLHRNGYGNFSVTPGDNSYWSSTESQYYNAWYRLFTNSSYSNGNPIDESVPITKNAVLRVRAVRKF